MIICRSISLIILFTLLSYSAKSQITFGFKVIPGISEISNAISESESFKTTNVYPLSGNAGLFVEYQWHPKLFVECYLSVNQFNDHEKIVHFHTGVTGEINGYKSYISLKRHITYISYPFSVGVRVNSFDFKIGGMLNFLVKSSGSEIAFVEDLNVYYENHFDKLYIPNFEYGPQAAISFHLNPKIAFDLNYYLSIQHWVQEDIYPVGWKNQQLGLGIKVSLFQSEK